MSEKASFSLRVDRTLLEKFKYVAEHEFRSSNGQLVHIIKANISEFEKEHGVIDAKK